MKLLIFSVYDKAVQAYLPPFFARSKGEAVRSFSEATNNKEHQFHKYAADYTLYVLGEFDDAAGLFSSGPAEPGRVISALECFIEDEVFPPEKRVS